MDRATRYGFYNDGFDHKEEGSDVFARRRSIDGDNKNQPWASISKIKEVPTVSEKCEKIFKGAAAKQDKSPVFEQADERKNLRVWPQVLGALAASMVDFCSALTTGYSGVMLPALTNATSGDLVLEGHHVSIYSSITVLFQVLGGLMTGMFMVWVGQRKVMMFCLPVILLCWLAHAFTPFIWLMHVTRAILGYCIGVYQFAALTYTLEISHPDYRTLFCGAIDCIRQVGLLFVCIIGSTQLHWREVAFVNSFCTIVPFVLLICLPDSPRWLATKSKTEDAMKSLIFFRGPKYDTLSELNHITEQLSETKNSDSVKSQCQLMFRDKSIFKRFLIILALQFYVQLTGNTIFVSYTTTIFNEFPAYFDEYSSTIFVGVVRVLAVVVYSIMCTKIGHRTLAVVPILVSGIMMFSLALLLFTMKRGLNISGVLWLPYVFIIIYLFGVLFNVAILNMYKSELLPNSVRSVAGAGLNPIHLGSFALLYFFPIMMQAVKVEGMFTFFGLNCLALGVFAYYTLPETKGKSLEEIDDLFRT